MEVVPQPIRPAGANSDHNMVIATVDLGGRLAHNRPVRSSPKRQFNRQDLQVEAARWAVSQRFLCNLLAKPGAPATTAQEMAEEFTEALLGAAETELCEEPQRRRPVEWNMTTAARAALTTAFDKRRAARHGFKVAQRPTTRATRRLAAVPDPEEVEAATKGLGNWKAVGPDLLAAELLKVDGDDEPIVRERLRAIFVEVWNGGEMPQEWKDVTTKELGRRRRIPLYMCFIDLQKAYDSVDRELLWKVLASAGIPAEIIAVIRKFHVGMRARVRMNDGELSQWFPVTQGLRQGCSMSPPLFNVFFAAPLEVIVPRFSQDEVITRDLVYLEEEGGGGGGTQLDRVRRAVWGVLYADDAGVVSKSAEGLGSMMPIIVEVFREFGLTVSERKTLTLVTPVKEKKPPPLIIEAAGQRYAQTTEFRYLGGLVNEHGDLTRENNHRSKAAWACFKRYKTELFDRPVAPFGLKARLLKAEAVKALLFGCVTWSPRRDHFRLLRTIHHQLLLRVIGHRRKRGTHRQLSYAQALKRVLSPAEILEYVLRVDFFNLPPGGVTTGEAGYKRALPLQVLECIRHRHGLPEFAGGRLLLDQEYDFDETATAGAACASDVGDDGRGLLFPGLRLLHAEPIVIGVDDFFTPEECDEYISRSVSPPQREYVSRAGMGPFEQPSALDSGKHTSTTFIHQFSEVPELMAKASALMGVDFADGQWEEAQTVRYRPGEEFSWHLDAMSPTPDMESQGGQRIANLLVYLNDLADDDGGATVFKNLGLRVRPRKGSALVFFPSFGGMPDCPLDPLLLHAGEMLRPDAGQDKWIAQLRLRQARTTPLHKDNHHAYAVTAIDEFDEFWRSSFML
eukprot:g11511.t2